MAIKAQIPPPAQETLGFEQELIPAEIEGQNPLYQTHWGSAYLGDSLELMKAIPTGSVNLVVTSPPYALHFKKAYGNASKAEYVET